MSGAIVVVGELMLDVLFAARAEGVSGAEVAPSGGGPGLYVRPGGSAATVALRLAAAGRRTIVVAKTGADPNGLWLRESLSAAGVRAPVAPARSMATGFVIIHRRTRSDRVVYVERGANRLLGTADVGTPPAGGAAGANGHGPALEGAGWLHVSGYCLLEPGPAEAARLLAHQARDAGIPVSLDPGNPRAFGGLGVRYGGVAGAGTLLNLMGLGLDGGPDHILPSAGMACFLTGQDDVREASAALARVFPGAVVKDGARGAWLGEENIGLQAGRPETGADVNGAGDVFDAAFISAGLEGRPADEAIREANSEASAYVAANSTTGGPARAGGWQRVGRQEPPIIISACLFDTASAYDNRPKRRARELDAGYSPARHLYLPVCPEQLGGLATPRDPAEVAGPGGGEAVLRGTARVAAKDGRDLTEAFLRGARRAADLVKATGAARAILKEGSPSCGVSAIGDGAFHGRRIPGRGVTAAALARLGLEVEAEEGGGA